MEIPKIIKMLTFLELPLDKVYNVEDVQKNYRNLAKIYHPDTASERYKDGQKYKELVEAKDYLINNYKNINELILNDFKDINQNSSFRNHANEKNNEPSLTKIDYNKYRILWIISILLLLAEVPIMFAFFVNYGCIFNPGDSYYPASISCAIVGNVMIIVDILVILYLFSILKKSQYIPLIILIPLSIALIFLIVLYMTGHYVDYYIGNHHFDYYTYDGFYFGMTIGFYVVTFITELVIFYKLSKFRKNY